MRGIIRDVTQTVLHVDLCFTIIKTYKLEKTVLKNECHH